MNFDSGTGFGKTKNSLTCHHLLCLVWLHVAVVLGCDFFRGGLSATSLLSIERVRIVFEDNELQEERKKKGEMKGGGKVQL